MGYTAEMWIDLTKIGYPVGLSETGGSSSGIDHLDGDSFTNWPDSYGSRVWWQREHAGGTGAGGGSRDGPAWGYLDPALQVVAVEPPGPPRGQWRCSATVPIHSRSMTSIYYTLARAERREARGLRSGGAACGLARLRTPAGRPLARDLQRDRDAERPLCVPAEVKTTG